MQSLLSTILATVDIGSGSITFDHPPDIYVNLFLFPGHQSDNVTCPALQRDAVPEEGLPPSLKIARRTSIPGRYAQPPPPPATLLSGKCTEWKQQVHAHLPSATD